MSAPEHSHASREDQFASLFALSPEPMAVFARESLCALEVNEAACALYGYVREAFLALTFGELFDSRRTPLRSVLEQTTGAGLPFSVHARHTSKGGRSFQVRVSGRPIEWEGEGAWLIAVHEIARAGQSRDSVRETEALLAGLVASAHEAVITITEDLCISSVNPAAAAMFRVRAADAIGQPIQRFIPAPYQEEYGARLLSLGITGAVRQPDALELLLLRADGEVFVGEAGIARGAAGGEEFIGIIVRDVTAHKQAESALRDSERRFHLLTSIAPVGILRMDPEGTCIYINDEGCDIVGRRLSEVLGVSWTELVHPGDEVLLRRAWEMANRENMPFELEFRVLRPDGFARWVECRARVERDEDGDVRSYIAALKDISERRRAQAALHESRELLDAIIDASPVGIEIYGPDGTLVRTNEAFRRFLRAADPNVFIGTYNALNSPEADIIGSRQLYEAAYRGETLEIFARPIDFRAAGPTSSVNRRRAVVDQTIFPVRGGGGEVRAVISFVHDVTERFEREQRRRRMEQTLRAVTRSGAILLFATDAKGVITLMDGGRLGSIGLSPGEAIGESIFEFVARHSGDGVAERDIRRALAGEAFSGVLDLGGKLFDARYSGIRGHERITGMICVAVYAGER